MYKTIKYWLFNKVSVIFYLCLFCVQYSFGQVSGTINDETGAPLIGANVMIQGSTTGTITDIDGNFSIDAKEGDVLVVSYVGYNDQLINVDGNTINLAYLLILKPWMK